jgi:hypothetical protein
MPIAKGKLSMPELELQLANRTDSDRISVGMHIKQWLLEMFYQFLVYSKYEVCVHVWSSSILQTLQPRQS